jgi:arylsulfatase A-like enzyme
VLALSGRVVTRSHTDTRAVDIMPTVLYALGVPLSRELAGRPVTELFDGSFLSRYPARFVSGYGAPSRAAEPARGQPLDQQMIDRLRSLGYVR